MRLLLSAAVLAGTLAAQPVSYQRILDAPKEPQNWLTYWGDYGATRFKDLNQINTRNVKNLRTDWMYQTNHPGNFETVPLVVDGIMYLTIGDGIAAALDARTGRQLWRYQYVLPEGRQASAVNRGFGILGDRLFMVTPDSHVVALEARTGRQMWSAEMMPWKAGTHYATLAPLVVKDKIIVGISGGEQGVRGFIEAYDANTGKRVWRFYTVPLQGEPGGDTWLADSALRGGGPAWLTGSYDPELNLLYWGVGNPGPDLNGSVRKGDNLYTCSILALDPDTGTLKWHYQTTPHDTHDWDSTEALVLLDLPWKGAVRKVVAQANRNGFFYVLDRKTGEFLLGKAFEKQTWNKGFDDKGRPIFNPDTEASEEGARVCPGLAGGANWMAPSYNPVTKLFYVAVMNTCALYYTTPPSYIEGKPYWGSVFRGVSDEKETGSILAIDPLTGETKWSFALFRPPWAGTLSTSGGLLFAGDEDGYFMAFDAADGKLLWKLSTGSRIVTSPITYMVDGKQYVTLPSGSVLITFALPD